MGDHSWHFGLPYNVNEPFQFHFGGASLSGHFRGRVVAIALAYILFVPKKEPQKDLQHEAAEAAPLNRRGLTA
jgi:hypothetical protein